MKQFFKFVFASCLGMCLFMLVVGIGGIGSIVRMASNDKKTHKVKANTLLTLDFSKDFPELTNNVEEREPLSQDNVIGLRDAMHAIERAKSDANIKGILIKPSMSAGGMGHATASQVRRALEDFKKSGKFILAYSDHLSQGSYYLASVADKITISPLGMVEFEGFGRTIPFFKDMLDKLGIKSQVYYAGQFKSATEPFRLNAMSPQNKLQVAEYLSNLYSIFLNDISRNRNIEVNDLHTIANELKVRTAHDAVKLKLIDAVGYYDEVLADLRKRLGLKEEEKIPTIGLADYDESNPAKSGSGTDKIAVVYAEGSIVMGSGDGNNAQIEGERYAKMIRKLRTDKNVRAIVLRVNSGGGSALASDLILRELDMAKAAGKPVLASFGDVAASGGYYIAAHADSIFAENNTITGSIGVFAMIPSMQKLFNDKLGIHFDTVKTAKYAAISATRDFTEDEGKIFQSMVDTIYENFVGLVAAGRKKSREQIHEVAQGRVWTGAKAKEIGLVDKIGGLEDAIASAAAAAKVSSYRVSEYPKIREPFEQIMDKLTGKKTDDVQKSWIKSELGAMYPLYEQLKSLQTMQGVQMRLPFAIEKLR